MTAGEERFDNHWLVVAAVLDAACGRVFRLNFLDMLGHERFLHRGVSGGFANNNLLRLRIMS